MNKPFLALALLLSVAVNLLVLGIVIGRGGADAEESVPMEWLTADLQPLQPETRRLIRSRMRDRVSEVRPLREDMRKATRALRLAISAESFSAEDLDKALAQWRNATQRYQSFIHGNLVDMSADLTKRERVALLRAAIQQRAPRQGRAARLRQSTE